MMKRTVTLILLSLVCGSFAAVERDHIYHLTDPVKPRMEVL